MCILNSKVKDNNSKMRKELILGIRKRMIGLYGGVEKAKKKLLALMVPVGILLITYDCLTHMWEEIRNVIA